MSPYTKTAGNVDARIFVLLQDWSSNDRLRGPIDCDAVEFGYMRSLPTNKKLEELLLTHFWECLRSVYATNLFPFVKMGSLSKPIPNVT